VRDEKCVENFNLENPKRRDQFGNLVVDERIIR
jgi:hypothetical protein